MKKRTMILAMIALMFTTGTGKVQAAEETSGLTIKPLTEKSVDANPYMVKNDANIHHDCYNTDTTDEVLPLGIYPGDQRFLRDKRMQMLLPPSILTATAMLLCRCWAALPSAT